MMSDMFELDLELEHVREINRILSRKAPPAAADQGRVIKEFSVDVGGGLKAVISVLFSPSGAWILPALYKDSRTIQELPACFGFIDRQYRFVSDDPRVGAFDVTVDIGSARFVHRENKFVRAGAKKRKC